MKPCVSAKKRRGHLAYASSTGAPSMLDTKRMLKNQFRVQTVPLVSVRRTSNKNKCDITMMCLFPAHQKIDLRPFKMRSTQAKTRTGAKMVSGLLKQTTIAGSLIAVIVPVKTSFLLGQRWSCTLSEGGAPDQVQDVDVWVSCWVQLWSEQNTTDSRIAPVFAAASIL